MSLNIEKKIGFLFCKRLFQREYLKLNEVYTYA